jgi:RNA polymerase sigma-32 factor
LPPSLESSFALYIEEIRRFLMLAPQEEFVLAKCWREYEDSGAAHKLVHDTRRIQDWLDQR